MGSLRDSLAPVSARERRAAIERLPSTAHGSVDELRAFVRDGLGDADFGVRWATTAWLRRAAPGWPEIVDVVADSLESDAEPQRRAAAMETLGQLGDLAVEALARIASVDNPGVRRLAVDALGLTRAAEAGAALIEASRDADPSVRAAAVESLSKIGTDAAVDAILAVLALPEEGPSVSLAALLAIETTERALSKEMLARHSEHPATAAVALRLLGREGALEPVVDNLVSLRRSRRRAALEGLHNALESHPEIRARAKEVVPLQALVDLCTDPDAAVVARAAVVLGRCGDLRGLVALANHEGGVRELARAHVAAQAARAEGVTDEQLRAARAAVESPEGLRLFDEATERRAVSGDAGFGALSDEDFDDLRARICDATGLLFERHAAERLASRLRPVARGLGAKGWPAFIAALDDEVALRAAIERVTVHETYFYREARQLDAFTELFLPDAIERSDELRVWSAGCATGEEAWTLAMIVAEASAGQPWRVDGTDISPAVVEEARRGVYGRRSFRGYLPEQLRDTYLTGGGDDHRVVDALRGQVQFSVDNLISSSDAADVYDAIFCRNVLIYLSQDARRRVIQRFFRSLRAGGVLFLGHSESLLHTDNPFDIVVFNREIAYRKPSGDE
jgi:chemotaxis protein methyltransferase CheR